MHILDVNRKLNEREIAQKAGRHRNTAGVLYDQNAFGFAEGDLAMLPIDGSANTPLQDATGTFYFTAGIDAIGTAPIAPAT
jgi:hypothetical protein